MLPATTEVSVRALDQRLREATCLRYRRLGRPGKPAGPDTATTAMSCRLTVEPEWIRA